MKKLLIVLSVIIVLLLFVAVYYGAFDKVVITEKEVGPYWIVYEKHIGEYKGIGKVMEKVYNDLLANDKITTTKGVGVYYDDPKAVESSKLRSIGGCILDDESKLNQLKDKYKIAQYPAAKAVVAEFNFKGNLSILFGLFKVYPELNKYMQAKNYRSVPIMEIYDMSARKILYLAPINADIKKIESFLEQ